MQSSWKSTLKGYSEYLALEKGLSENSIDAYKHDVNQFADFLLGEYGIDAALAEEKPWEWRPEFLSVNPGGNLPVLLLENAAICGIYPITEYLLEIGRDGEEPNLP